jgi:uncharacterized protein
MTAWPLPRPDRDSAPFWSALRRHEIRIQRCDGCGRLRFPPRSVCWQCGSEETSWELCSGRAGLVTWTVTHQAFGPAFRDHVPYTLAVVRLAEQEDLLMYGNLRQAEPGALRVGLPLEAQFEDVSPEFSLLNWRPAGGPQDRG